MKPYVICHMLGSFDGRIKGKNWGIKNLTSFFEGPAAKIKVDAWLVGRTTMQEFASKRKHPKRSGRFLVPKTDFVAKQKAKCFAVAIDPSGKCRWDTNMVSTEHVIEVLTEKVTGEYLDHLRNANVSYIFGGKDSLDLGLVLEKLRKLFGIKRVRIDGGGHVNGSFLRAGLIDEFSFVLAPVADGTTGSLCVFEEGNAHRGKTATKIRLLSIRRLKQNFVWLRYKTVKG